MTSWAVIGLLEEAVALCLLIFVLRHRSAGFVGAIFLFVATIYHGLTELANTLLPGHDLYRLEVSKGMIGPWIGTVGTAVLITTVVYVMVLGRARASSLLADSHSTRLPSWKACLVGVLPLYIVTLHGRGVGAGKATDLGSSNYFSSGLAQAFLVLGVVLMATSWVTSRPDHPIGRALLLQSLVLSVVGQRFTIVVSSLMLIAALASYGIRLSRQQLRFGLIFLLLFAFVISSARAQVGRQAFASASAGERVSALGAGVAHLGSVESRQQIMDDTLYRFDGNAMPSLIAYRASHGYGYIGTSGFVIDLELAVPSFLNPGKLHHLSVPSEKLLVDNRYSLNENQDYLPTVYGTLDLYGGAAVLYLMSVLIGALLATFDRWTHRGTLTAGRLVLFVGMVQSVALYEEGPSAFTIALRAAVILGLVFGIGRVLRIVSQRRPVRLRGRLRS